MRIFLVRHGETTANLNKIVYKDTADHAVPLSDLGHTQASVAGEKLAKRLMNPADRLGKLRVWSSP